MEEEVVYQVSVQFTMAVPKDAPHPESCVTDCLNETIRALSRPFLSAEETAIVDWSFEGDPEKTDFKVSDFDEEE